MSPNNQTDTSSTETVSSWLNADKDLTQLHERDAGVFFGRHECASTGASHAAKSPMPVRCETGNDEKADHVKASGVTIHRAIVSGTAQAQFGDRYDLGTTNQYHQHEEHYHIAATLEQDEAPRQSRIERFSTYIGATTIANLITPYVKGMLELVIKEVQTGRVLLQQRADQCMSRSFFPAPQEAWEKACNFLCSDTGQSASLCAALSCSPATKSLPLWSLLLVVLFGQLGPGLVAVDVANRRRKSVSRMFCLAAQLVTMSSILWYYCLDLRQVFNVTSALPAAVSVLMVSFTGDCRLSPRHLQFREWPTRVKGIIYMLALIMYFWFPDAAFGKYFLAAWTAATYVLSWSLINIRAESNTIKRGTQPSPSKNALTERDTMRNRQSRDYDTSLATLSSSTL